MQLPPLFVYLYEYQVHRCVIINSACVISSSGQSRVHLEFNNVSVTLGNREILRSVYVSASPGEILAVLGPSGMIIVYYKFIS